MQAGLLRGPDASIPRYGDQQFSKTSLLSLLKGIDCISGNRGLPHPLVAIRFAAKCIDQGHERARTK